MTASRNKTTRVWEADITDRKLGRLHVSLKTKVKSEADDRHAAVKALMREGHADLVQLLRERKLNIESVVRAHRDQTPFAQLRESPWPTLHAAVEGHLEWLANRTDIADSTYQLARQQLGIIEDILGRDTRLDAITGEQCERLRTGLLSRLQESTALGYLIRLSALYGWVAERERRHALEAKRVPRYLHCPVYPELTAEPKELKPAPRFLLPSEAERLLAATPDRYQFVVRAALFCGLRQTEALTLRPPPLDVDLSHGFLIIQGKEGFRPKTRSSWRHVPMDDVDMLPYARRHAEAYASSAWMTPILSAGDRYFAQQSWDLIFRRIVEDAELIPGSRKPNGVSFHTLRHTWASWAIMADVNLFTIMKHGGWSSLKELERTYGHLALRYSKEATAKVRNFWRSQAASIPGSPTMEAAKNA